MNENGSLDNDEDLDDYGEELKSEENIKLIETYTGKSFDSLNKKVILQIIIGKTRSVNANNKKTIFSK